MKHPPVALLIAFLACCPFLLVEAQSSSESPLVAAQAEPASRPSVSPGASNEQNVAEILRMMGEMRQEMLDSRHEVESLRKEVTELRAKIASGNDSSVSAESLKSAVDQLHDDQEMVQTELKTLQQTKVETASKYPLRFSGMVLFNSFVVDGAVDNPILPQIAVPRNGNYTHHSLGGSIEQTQFGLEATGPHLWNARTSADVSVDFFNPTTYTAIPPATTMNLRLRTADVNIDWTRTRISAGFQTPIVSPLSPTSFATVGQPSLAWSGNLWTWLPQIAIEHQVQWAGSSRGVLAFGLLDPTTNNVVGERPNGILRRSVQPGYEARIAYQWGDTDQPYEIGAGGYYTRQLYYGQQSQENQSLDFWAGTADWRIPVAKNMELSGELYRGRGIGDLGGGAFKNIISPYNTTYPAGLDAIGGWAQLKTRLGRLTEFNAFFGEDSAEASEVRNRALVPPAQTTPYANLVRNQTAGANLIFRPKTYLVFSGEYRSLTSWYVYNYSNYAQTLNLGMGYIF